MRGELRLATISIAIGTLISISSASARDASATKEAQRLFAEKGVLGAIVVQDVANDAVVVALPAGGEATFLPLSVTKLFLAASYWEHKEELPKAPAPAPDVNAKVRRSLDDPGRKLALDLRRALGSEALLQDLGRFGFPRCGRLRTNCTLLSTTTSDAAWADAMSIGEAHFQVTLLGLSHFLMAIARDGQTRKGTPMMRASTAKLLRSVMLETVRDGTARGIKDRLGAEGQIGGKTGSGPGGAQPTDGIFAALVFDANGAARYTIVTYVRRGGLGGGAAANISADMALFLLRAKRRTTP